MNTKRQLFVIVAVLMFTCLNSDGLPVFCPPRPKGAPGSPPPVCLGPCNCVAENCPGRSGAGVCDCTCHVCAKREGNNYEYFTKRLKKSLQIYWICAITVDAFSLVKIWFRLSVAVGRELIDEYAIVALNVGLHRSLVHQGKSSTFQNRIV